MFECLSPYGEIGPGMTANIEWRFSPLEAKTYTVSHSSPNLLTAQGIKTLVSGYIGNSDINVGTFWGFSNKN